MDLEQDVNTFYRAGIGLITAVISLAFLALTLFLLFKTHNRFALEFIVFVSAFSALSWWFGRISYRLFRTPSNKRAAVLSPLSIIVIFALCICGSAAGAIYRFTTGDANKGFLGMAIMCVLFPVGHYCWKQARQRS